MQARSRLRPRARLALTVPLALAALAAPGVLREASAQQTIEELSREPVFTPMTVRPRILNQDEVLRAMQEAYPPTVRDAGVGGTVVVHFLVDTAGVVRKTAIERSSGQPLLDQAALNVASQYRFSPARNREQVVPVWVSFPITFRVGR
jgi:TonB family protein